MAKGKANKKKDKKKNFKKYALILWAMFLLGLAFIILLFFFISKGYLGYIPTWDELENPQSSLATQIMSDDHVELGTFFKENRVLVEYEDLSPNLVKALVSTEDERFYEHSGVDTRALLRAIVYMGKNGGGSTITQQLAKQLYHEPVGSVWERIQQKLNEWVMAVKLERRYTKNEIITMYFNRFDFLNLSVGIKTAAHVYFNTTPKKLNIQEAATLVGMCKNPAFFNPLRFPERVQKRRNVVLFQMKKNQHLTQAQYDSLKVLPLGIDFQKVDHSLGLAPYFREHIRLLMSAKKPQRKNYWGNHAYQVDSAEWMNNPLYGWIEKNPKPNGEKYNLYSDGLKIYTTIDSRLQEHAEQAVREHIGEELQKDFWKEKRSSKKAPFSEDLTQKQINKIMLRALKQTDRYRGYRAAKVPMDSILELFKQPVKTKLFSWSGTIDTLISPMDSLRYYKHFLRASLLSINPKNGHIKAYVGGTNYRYFKYDMAFKGRRQVGSTFKPILYSLALREDYTPCSKLPNVPFAINLPEGGTWMPRNEHSKTEGQMITLKEALASSNNYISAFLVNRYSPQAMVNLAYKLGVTSDIDVVPSVCLGTADVSLYEMLPIYATFANKGVHIKPLLVTHIKDKNGNLIARFSSERTEVYNEKTAYMMVNLLEGVVNRGTSIRLRLKYKMKNAIYGKTGTTQNQSDGWFFGVVPRLATGVWVGGEDRSIHFNGIRLGQGANMALPIWALYMKHIYEDKNLDYSLEDVFEKPQGFNIELDCDKVEEQQRQKIDYGLDF